jgi:hypothetical protein
MSFKLKHIFHAATFLVLFENQFLSISTPVNNNVQRIVLVYVDKYNNMTLPDYKLLLAYHSESGINDSFFNTFLFLGQFSNTNESYEGYEKGSSYKSWLWWLTEKIFGKNG